LLAASELHAYRALGYGAGVQQGKPVMVRVILFGLTAAMFAATSASAQNSSTWIRVQQPWQGVQPGAPTVPGAPGASTLPRGPGQLQTQPGGAGIGTQGGHTTLFRVQRNAEGASTPGKGGSANAIRFDDTPGNQKGKSVGGFKPIGGMKSETEIVE
jgi:hypothetical protein